MNTIEVTQRFVQSYYNLYQHRLFTHKKQFCDAIGIHTCNFNAMKNGKRTVTTQHLCMLFKKYNISPVWIFTGNGSFFADGTN